MVLVLCISILLVVSSFIFSISFCSSSTKLYDLLVTPLACVAVYVNTPGPKLTTPDTPLWKPLLNAASLYNSYIAIEPTFPKNFKYFVVVFSAANGEPVNPLITTAVPLT